MPFIPRALIAKIPTVPTTNNGAFANCLLSTHSPVQADAVKVHKHDQRHICILGSGPIIPSSLSTLRTTEASPFECMTATNSREENHRGSPITSSTSMSFVHMP